MSRHTARLTQCPRSLAVGRDAKEAFRAGRLDASDGMLRRRSDRRRSDCSSARCQDDSTFPGNSNHAMTIGLLRRRLHRHREAVQSVLAHRPSWRCSSQGELDTIGRVPFGRGTRDTNRTACRINGFERLQSAGQLRSSIADREDSRELSGEFIWGKPQGLPVERLRSSGLFGDTCGKSMHNSFEKKRSRVGCPWVR